MRKIVILSTILMLSLYPALAQEKSFADEAQKIAQRIDSITQSERNALVLEIEEIDRRLENAEISAAEAKNEREFLAEVYAERIERKVNFEKEKLDELIASRVENRVYEKNDEDDMDSIVIKFRLNPKNISEKRTTSQFVFAVGVNTLTGDNQMFDDNLKVWPSRFWEFGYTKNTRILNESNLLHIKYGLSLLYNNYKPENNMIFAKDGNQTILEPTDLNFKRNRFRNFYVNLPVHLEFDLSPNKFDDEGKRIFSSHESFRLGLGGYIGVLVNSKNFLKYKENGETAKFSIKDNYHVNDFNYGLSAYIGYKEFSFYTKYDLETLFKHNHQEVQNLSFGLRWDFN